MEKASVVSYIVRLVSEVSPNPIAGGQLSIRTKMAFPEFNPFHFGCKNLREFIRNHIPEVAERGKAGMDVIYGLRAQQVELFGTPTIDPRPSPDRNVPLGQLLTNPRIWKTFASPESPFRLYLLPSGLIRVLRPEEMPDPSWPEIPSISAECLAGMAKDFISELPETQQGMLLRTLEQPRWWFPYYDLLGTFGLKLRWVSFRRRRIAEEFERALSEAKAVSQAPGESKTSESSPRPGELNEQESVLRKVASIAIRRMTDSELRALNLPLGYVIDALTAK
jgi:hypothetical protein